MTFSDRSDAGIRLAQRLASFCCEDTVICGIPRGGAIVAADAARAGGFDYECFVICRIGMPCFPEVTLAAVDADGQVLYDPETELTRFEMLKISDSLMRHLAGRVAMCRGDRKEPDFANKTAIVVDEYVREPLVALKAVDYLRRHGAARVVLATPALARDAEAMLGDAFDDIIAILRPESILAASEVYGDADDPTDDEIAEHLKAAWSGMP